MYLHIPIDKHQHKFLWFVCQQKCLQWIVLLFGLATVSRVFTSLTKPMLFLCRCKGFYVKIYLDDFLFKVCLNPIELYNGLSWIAY